MKYTLLYRTLFLLIACVLTGKAAHAHAPAWQLALAISSTGNYSEVRATATDNSGNVYIAGQFYKTMQVGTTTLVSTHPLSGDMFVAKWSSDTRSFTWAQQAGSSGYDYATSLVVSGNAIYLSGGVESQDARFGALTLPSSNSNSSKLVAFVAKLEETGTSATFTWIRGRESTETSIVNALAIVGSQIYVTGGFTGVMRAGTVSLIGTGDGEVFVAKLRDEGTSGSVIWAERMGGAGFDEANGLAVVGNALYITGEFEGTATVGTSGPSVTSVGSTDVFVAKLFDVGATATCSWLQRAGGTDTEYGIAIAVNGDAVYIAGEFTSATTTFGTTTLVNVKPLLSDDIFVAKLTDAGSTANFSWAQRAGGTDLDEVTYLGVRGTELYMAGIFTGPTAGFGTTVLTNSGQPGTSDIFAACLRDVGSTGRFMWAQQAGSATDDYGATGAIAGPTFYVAGSARTPTSFGSHMLLGTEQNAIAFLAVLPIANGLATAAPATGQELRLAPNPAHELVTVVVPEVAGAQFAALNLLDALGRVVRTQTATLGTAVPLVLAGLPRGLYLLHVQVGKDKAWRRLVVE
ncbi:MAG: T9SS type A sorting domain-containing protein [Hymenobacter sp.]|nr:MAG: T9SS type A sorting domain-containing protein [Hymenobacter sp.]